MFGFLRRSPRPKIRKLEKHSQPKDDENVTEPPTYVLDGILVEAYELLPKNRKAVEVLSALMLDHASKLNVCEQLRSSENDKYVISYIAGIIDALCQTGGLTNEDQRIGMLERIYSLIFKKGFATNALDIFISSQNDPEVERAVIDGGNDFLDFNGGIVKTFPKLFQCFSKDFP